MITSNMIPLSMSLYCICQVNLARRVGIDGDDVRGMAWDEVPLPSVVTSTVKITGTGVYLDLRCGVREIEFYTGTSE